MTVILNAMFKNTFDKLATVLLSTHLKIDKPFNDNAMRFNRFTPSECTQIYSSAIENIILYNSNHTMS